MFFRLSASGCVVSKCLNYSRTHLDDKFEVRRTLGERRQQEEGKKKKKNEEEDKKTKIIIGRIIK